MHSRHIVSIGAAGLLAMMIVARASASLSATATISSAQNGSNYNYTVQLKNTGSTDIGTFWFAWTPPGDPIEYDFLPSAPSATSEPAGWAGPVSTGFPGYSIEYYNVSGSAILSGQTGTFGFTTTDSPATLQGLAFGIFPITESFIYAGAPEVGATAQVNPVFVTPEPSSFILLAIGGVFAANSGRARRSARE